MLQKIAPILPAINIQQTNLYYKNRLSFHTRDYGNYLVVQKDLIEWHYYLWNDKIPFMPASCYLFDNNVEDLFLKLSAIEVLQPKAELKKNIWGKNEFQLIDNNGNLLRFSGV